jgi:hypothetical protein
VTVLLTASWSALYQASKQGTLPVQPVRISRSGPRFWPGGRFPVVRELVPVEGSDEHAYRKQLDGIDVAGLTERFDALSAENGLPLALCCFEADPADCHRSWWASWWQEQTGQAVPELGASPAGVLDPGRATERSRS